MIGTLFLMFAAVPFTLGIGYLFRPRKMARIQSRYYKRLERAQKWFIKSHRLVGLGFVSMGFMVILTYFNPVWLYNAILVVRVVSGIFFPQVFEPTQVEAIPMVCI